MRYLIKLDCYTLDWLIIVGEQDHISSATNEKMAIKRPWWALVVIFEIIVLELWK